MRENLLLAALLFFLAMQVEGQDIRFTQYYQAPIYLNPAFTGASGAARLGTNYRKQGTNDESEYESFSAFGDYYIKDLYLSGGLLFTSDKDQYSGFSSQSIAVPISYNFSINKEITVKPALQGSYTRQGIDFSRFLFSDQIDANGNMTGGGSAEPLAVDDQISFFDVGAGVVVFGERWWAGYAMHNMLQNNVSYVQGGEAILPIRYSAHAGYTFFLGKHTRKTRMKKTIMPTFNYVSQGGFSQLDAGAILQLEPILLGAFYRGIPNPLTEGEYSAVSWVVGISKFDLSIGYSFDMPLNTPTDPGGIHEISLTFLFDPTDPNATPRSAKRLRCPLPY